MKQTKHWQDPVNAVLGAWLALSPWVLGFQDQMAPMANAVVIGVVLIAVALGAFFVPHAWEEWTEGALGLWMVISPWVLGFSLSRDAMVSTVVTGLIVMVLALWVLATDEQYSTWREDRTAR